MKKTLLALLSVYVCAFAVLVTSCKEDEETGTGSVSGIVTNAATGMTIQGATVTLSPSGRSTTTREDGYFLFESVVAKAYDLSVTADGYKSNTKNIIVVGGQTVQADIAMTRTALNVNITPQTLTFGPNVNQLSFQIKNGSSSVLSYTLSSYESYLSVTPTQAQINANGTQTVMVSVDRSKLTSTVSTQLLVNIEGDSYPVSVTINVTQ